MMNLSVGEVPEDAEVLHSLYLLSADRSRALLDHRNFNENGYLSFAARSGVFAVRMALNSDQYDACGADVFDTIIKTEDGMIVVEYDIRIRVLQPIPQPRQTTPVPMAQT